MAEENKELQNELDDILEGFVPPPSTSSEEPPVEAPVVETPVEQPIVEEKGNVEEGKERPAETSSEQVPPVVGAEEGKEDHKIDGEPPVTPVVPPVAPVAPVTPPVVEPLVETNEQRLAKENEELRQQMVELAGRVVEGPKPPTKTPEQIEHDRVQAARAVLGFIKNPEQYDEVFKSHENFNALLTSVVNTAVERAIRMIPQVTTQYVDQQFTLRTAASDFYRENEDLLPHKKYVGFITNEVQAEHPDWALPELLTEAEKITRTRLKLPKPTGGNGGPVQPVQPTGTTRSSRTVENPGFTPSGGGGRRGSGASPLTGEAAEINDLIS